MPIYEYHCADCRRRVSLLVMRISDPEAPGVHAVGRAAHPPDVSVRHPPLQDARLESLADPGQLGDLDEDIPAASPGG